MLYVGPVFGHVHEPVSRPPWATGHIVASAIRSDRSRLVTSTRTRTMLTSVRSRAIGKAESSRLVPMLIKHPPREPTVVHFRRADRKLMDQPPATNPTDARSSRPIAPAHMTQLNSGSLSAVRGARFISASHFLDSAFAGVIGDDQHVLRG